MVLTEKTVSPAAADFYRLAEDRKEKFIMNKKLFEACMSGDERALQELIQDDPLILDRAVTCCEETPLHVAVLRGRLSFIRALLRLKRELASQKDASGSSPLHLASAGGGVEVVRELLRADASVCSARDNCGRTPLHLAVMKGRLDVVRELTRVCPRSSLERLDRGETVFHLSIRYCRMDALKLLVELLKDDLSLLVATDYEGNTVLHCAAFFKQIETIRYLLSLEEVKAIANATNDNGHTALDVMENEMEPRDFTGFEIMEKLIEAGIKTVKDKPQNPTISHDSALPTTTNPVHTDSNIPSQIKKLFEGWFHDALEHLRLTQAPADPRGSLMVVAILAAGICYQAGINPPGGVWQQDTTDSHICTEPYMCRAGTAVLKDAKGFRDFYSCNTSAFVAAISVVLLHLWEFAYKTRMGIGIMKLTTCFMLDRAIRAYVSSTNMMFRLPPYSENNRLFYAWKGMLMVFVVVHSTRIWYWLMFEKVSSLSFLSEESIFCRCRWIRTVACLVGTFVTVSLFVWME